MSKDKGTSRGIVEVLETIAEAVTIISDQTKPAEPAAHPLGHLSKEEIAIILAVRGDISSKKDASRKLGVSYPTVYTWKIFCKTFDSIKAGERMGSLVLGNVSKGGVVDGIIQDHCNATE